MAIQGDLFRQASSSTADVSGILERQFASIGQAAAGAINKIGENKKAEEEKEEKKRKLLLEETKQLNSEFTPEIGEDDSEIVANAKLDAGRRIADRAATIQREYMDTGDIETWQKKNAELQKQLGKVEQGDQYVNSIAQQYDDYAADPDSVSKATSPQAIAMAKGMKNGTVNVSVNDDGVAVYTGKYKDANGEWMEVPAGMKVGNEGNLPALIDKVDDPKKTFMGLNINVNKQLRDTSIKDGIEFTGTSWQDPQVQAAYEEAIQGMVNDDASLMSIAADYYGHTNVLHDLNDPEAKQKLKDVIKESLYYQAETQFFGNEQGKVSAQEQLANQEERLALAKKNAETQTSQLTENQRLREQQKAEVLRFNASTLEAAAESGNYGNVAGLRVPGVQGQGGVIGFTGSVENIPGWDDLRSSQRKKLLKSSPFIVTVGGKKQVFKTQEAMDTYLRNVLLGSNQKENKNDFTVN